MSTASAARHHRRRRPRGDHERRARRAPGARPGDHIGLSRGLPRRGRGPCPGPAGLRCRRATRRGRPPGGQARARTRAPASCSTARSTSAGRHPDSDIFLDDVTVSRRHAEFRRDAGEFVVVDVGSLNGTYVNREPVDTAVLANGDEVQIGKFRLVFHHRSPRTDRRRIRPGPAVRRAVAVSRPEARAEPGSPCSVGYQQGRAGGGERMSEMRVVGVRVELPANQPILLLRETAVSGICRSGSGRWRPRRSRSSSRG